MFLIWRSRSICYLEAPLTPFFLLFLIRVDWSLFVGRLMVLWSSAAEDTTWMTSLQPYWPSNHSSSSTEGGMLLCFAPFFLLHDPLCQGDMDSNKRFFAECLELVLAEVVITGQWKQAISQEVQIFYSWQWLGFEASTLWIESWMNEPHDHHMSTW